MSNFIKLLEYEYTLADIIGNLGVVILIGTYAALMTGHISAEGWHYPLLNLVAALLLTFSLLYNPNLSSLMIEFFWIIISLVGLYRYTIKK